MDPQQRQSFDGSKDLDVSHIPDLRTEWSSIASKDVWGPTAESSSDSKFSNFSVHRGAKFVAEEGSFVSTDAKEPPAPPQEYSTRVRTSYLRVGPLLRPLETKVREPIEAPARPYLSEAQVEAQQGSKVLAENASVSARMGSFVQAGRNSTVDALEGSLVRAQHGSTVVAHDGSRVLAEDASTVTARGGSKIVALDGSRVIAQPGAHIDARSGSTITLVRAGDNLDLKETILKTEKGASVNVIDPRVIISPETQGEIRFTGNKEDWEAFRQRNPDIKIATPDYTTLADLVTGEAESVKRAKREAAAAPQSRDANPFSGKKEPPSPAPEGNYKSLERVLNNVREYRRRAE